MHGLSIPLGKLGYHLPRTISEALSTQTDDPEPFHIQNNGGQNFEQGLRRRGTGSSAIANGLPNRVYRIGRSIIRSNDSSANPTRASSRAPVVLSAAPTLESTSQGPTQSISVAQSSQERVGAVENTESTQPSQIIQRTIRFPDEQLPASA